MPAITIDQRSALVLIDLQKGILALPTLLSQDDIKNRTRRLAAAFRATALPVVRVKVAFSADGGDLPPGRALVPGPKTPRRRRTPNSPTTSPRTPATSSWSSGTGGRSPEPSWTSSSAAAA
jgi:nicotinamidase-related amidase